MFCCFTEEVLDHSNINLADIVTPVKASILQQLLSQAGYDKVKTEFLVKGFTDGFCLNYSGPLSKGRRFANNLKFRIGTPLELWNKVMKEVELGRYAGPFEEPPFEDFVQSPIGLVPKDKGKKTRLIFHLSYPRGGNSVNSGIPKEYCSVKYPDFEEAVKLCLAQGANCHVAKSDMSSAFRHVPMRKDLWSLLVMKATHPLSKVTYYFVDKCLPFGSSISCAIFQAVSDAIAFLVSFRTKKVTINYLDDYLFAAFLKKECDRQVKVFLLICSKINFPVALEKTFWGTTVLTFLGLLLDTGKQLVCIPLDKIEKAITLIDAFLEKRKTTVLQYQKLAGSLNFLCRCIVPGRAFLRRLYLTGYPKLKQHHHVKITREHKMDLAIWKQFLTTPDIFYRSFMKQDIHTAEAIDMYSDASRNFELGFGAYCGSEWSFGQWDKDFCSAKDPSIEYLELFGVAVALLNWLKFFRNSRIVLFCDNQAVVNMINNDSSKCKNCMVLIRFIVLEGLCCNTRVYTRYVKSKDNAKADALSRLQWDKFRHLAARSGMNQFPTAVPSQIWPMHKIWLDV